MEQDKGKRQETQKVREKEKSQLASDGDDTDDVNQGRRLDF